MAFLFVLLDHVASLIVNANHGIMRATAMLSVSDCIRDRIRTVVAQATE
jgi:hypothetical protein